MKELKIHSNAGGNLCSITSFDDNYPDRLYLGALITALFNSAHGLLYVKVSRPNYLVDNVIQDLKKLDLLNNSLLVKPDNFELSFLYKKRKIESELKWALANIWFAFEHVNYTFFVNEDAKFPQREKPWDQTTTESQAYVVFKGAEENVVWLGKSNELDFITIPA